VKDIINFLLIALVESALDTGIAAENNLAFSAFLGWYLHFLAIETFNIRYFLEFHPLCLTSFLELKFLIVAEFTRIVDLTAWSLDMTYIQYSIQFLL
jgi:hypothetical protein